MPVERRHMSHQLRRLALVAVGGLLAIPWAIRPAAAAPLPTLTVSVAVDQPTMTVDKSPGVPAVAHVLTYTIVVENTTTDPSAPPAHGVKVVDELPAGLSPAVPAPAGATVSGNTVTFDVGDLGYGAWQATLRADVVSTNA